MYQVNTTTLDVREVNCAKKRAIGNTTGSRGVYIKRGWAVVYFDGSAEQIISLETTEQEAEKKSRKVLDEKTTSNQ
jgi:hypothetical protein